MIPVRKSQIITLQSGIVRLQEIIVT